MDSSPPGSSVHGNSPGKSTGWSGLPFPSPGDLPNSGIEIFIATRVSLIAEEFFTVWATREALRAATKTQGSQNK